MVTMKKSVNQTSKASLRTNSSDNKSKAAPSQPDSYKKSKSIFHSFGYALRGIGFGFLSERNVRFDFFVAALVLYFSKYYALTAAQYGVLYLVIGAVICSELFNTALERTVDLVTADYHRLAKIAKDLSAGATLTMALASLGVGLHFFGDLTVIRQILADIRTQALFWILVGITALLIIFLPDILYMRYLRKEKQNRAQQANANEAEALPASSNKTEIKKDEEHS